MAKHGLLELINGYSTAYRNDEETPRGKYFISKSLSGRMEKRRGNSPSAAVYGFMGKLEDLIMYTKTRSYGFMALTFGLLTIILHFGGDFFIEAMSADISSIIIGAVCALFSVPFLFSSESLSVQLQDIPITRWLLYDFLCLRRTHRTEDKLGIPTYVLVVFGVIAAALGFFVPVKYLALGFFVAVFVHFAFQSPEFSLMITLLVLPYVLFIPYGEYVFIALTVITLLSLVRKANHGKRVIFVEQYDVLVILLILVSAALGVFMNGGVDTSLALAVVPFIAYFLGSNLTSNIRIADCAMSAVVISSVPLAVMTAVNFVKSIIAGDTLVEYFVSGKSPVFNSFTDLSVFLTVAVLFSAFFVKEKSGGAKGFYSLILLLDAIALLLSGVLVSALIIGFCIALYSLFSKNKYAGIAALVFAALLYLVYFLPSGILSTALRGLSVAGEEQLLVRSEGIDIFLDNFIFGIGAGEESVFSELASRGYYFNQDLGNIFIELACESGIAAFLLFLMIVTVRVRHTGVYFSYLKSSSHIDYSVIMSVSLFSVIGYGAFTGILSDPVLSFVMWFVFGMGSAILRIVKSEFDDRRTYFRDQRSFDSSETEIVIRE